MARSVKFNIIKEGSSDNKRLYHRTIRRVNNQFVKTLDKQFSFLEYIDVDVIEEFIDKKVKRNKEIINDYNYCDYVLFDNVDYTLNHKFNKRRLNSPLKKVPK